MLIKPPPSEVRALLAAVTVDQVMSAYSGKADRCYCGCSGTHSYASKHQAIASVNRGYDVADDELNDRAVKRILNIVKKNFAYDPEVDMCGSEPFHIQAESDPTQPGKGFVTHFSAVVGKRSYTVYLLPKTA